MTEQSNGSVQWPKEMLVKWEFAVLERGHRRGRGTISVSWFRGQYLCCHLGLHYSCDMTNLGFLRILWWDASAPSKTRVDHGSDFFFYFQNIYLDKISCRAWTFFLQEEWKQRKLETWWDSRKDLGLPFPFVNDTQLLFWTHP